MTEVLLDTSVLIEFLRAKGKKTAFEQLLARGWRPAISFITLAELWAGKSVWESKEKTAVLEKLLSGMRVILPAAEVLKLSGKLKAEYGISLLDAFIAAEALQKKLPLATLNQKDFGKIKGLKLLQASSLKPAA